MTGLDSREALAAAYRLASRSKDPSTQNAAMIYTNTGEVVGAVNDIVEGAEFEVEDWLDRPTKYMWVEHAERNAIYEAAFHGTTLNGATMVACWAACLDCAKAIVQSGITTLIRHMHPYEERWGASILDGDRILKAGGVKTIDVFGPLYYAAHPVKFNGRWWNPNDTGDTIGIHVIA